MDLLGAVERGVGYLQGTLLLNNFFWAKLHRLKHDLPNPDTTTALVRSGKGSFKIEVDGDFPKRYNEDLRALRTKVLQCVPRSVTSFPTTAASFFALRIVLAIAAISAFSPSTVFIVSLMQFVILPYSFIASFQHLIVLGLPLFFPHYASLTILHFIVPNSMDISLPVSGTLVVTLVVLDQLMCYLLCYETPKGRTVPMDRKTLATHFVYGFLNCKTYSVILLLLLWAQNFNIRIVIWLLDASLGLTTKIAGLLGRLTMDWATIYYHQHRIAHLPMIYEQSHKFHHYLHDTTPFDAHIYGAGAPEEWFALVLEAGMALRFGQLPAILNYSIMMQSISSKIGHSRSTDASGGINHHADHHTLHRKNFGFGSNVLVDMLFETNSDNDKYQLGPYTVQKEVFCDEKSPTDVGKIVFTFNTNGNTNMDELMESYYNPSMLNCLKVAFQRFSEHAG